MNATLTHRFPGYTLTRPFDQSAALLDLRALGQKLDRQAAIGASKEKLDETLSVMSEVHGRIVVTLTDALMPTTERRWHASRVIDSELRAVA
ncbi:hypothetical protein E6W39_19030 [Kitasatospora acidiphila]|uniref:Uncharacterized protein n=1 Tax=Kitasatospora acidiphila TaxID=2567942 RepID=A0A540W4K5_9ACTN|nr:hypothetical protein [Kitasatospora acidiphila]TQF03946.1 hypothetical protein E6W39_19030 [Kitasatospora acidiphila]